MEYSFLGDHVETKTVRMLNGEILEIHLNPFNFQGGKDELREVSQIISETMKDIRPHRIHVVKAESQDAYDYACLIVPPSIDHLVKHVTPDQIVIRIQSNAHMSDLIDYTNNTNDRVYHRMVLHVSGVSGVSDLSQFGEQLSRHFPAYEMEWNISDDDSGNNTLLSIMSAPFSTVFKFTVNQPITLVGMEILYGGWSNLSELCIPFDASMITNVMGWEQVVTRSSIDTLVILYNLRCPYSFREFFSYLRQWRQFACSVNNLPNQHVIRLVVLNRIKLDT